MELRNIQHEEKKRSEFINRRFKCHGNGKGLKINFIRNRKITKRFGKFEQDDCELPALSNNEPARKDSARKSPNEKIITVQKEFFQKIQEQIKNHICTGSLTKNTIIEGHSGGD